MFELTCYPISIYLSFSPLSLSLCLSYFLFVSAHASLVAAHHIRIEYKYDLFYAIEFTSEIAINENIFSKLCINRVWLLLKLSSICRFLMVLSVIEILIFILREFPFFICSLCVSFSFHFYLLIVCACAWLFSIFPFYSLLFSFNRGHIFLLHYQPIFLCFIFLSLFLFEFLQLCRLNNEVQKSLSTFSLSPCIKVYNCLSI